MWYAVQVKTGEEDKVKLLCDRLISNWIMEECFIPKYEKKKKITGSWHKILNIMFPGYIFMISKEPVKLNFALQLVPGLTKILGKGQEIYPLHNREVNFLKQFGRNDHILEMSYGYIEGDEVVFTEGPMMDFQGKLKKIDRHKRVATIEVEFFERRMDVVVGLEVVRKN